MTDQFSACVSCDQGLFVRFISSTNIVGGSVAEWLACWTQAQKGPGSQSRRCRVTVLGITVHTHYASVHQAAKLVAALLRVVGVTAGLPPGLWLASSAGWLPRTGISSGTLRSVIEYGLPLPFLWIQFACMARCNVVNMIYRTCFVDLHGLLQLMFPVWMLTL